MLQIQLVTNLVKVNLDH